jgi:septal ring factor EnvC (AmiA/AmiB activator)
MAFESVRAYVQLASGLGDLTRARATEAAQGLLSLPATSIATGTKMASQATALADELLAAAAANRSNLTIMVRDEVDAAIMARLGLVPVAKLQEAQQETTRLREELARLRSASSAAAAPRSGAKKAAAPKVGAKKAAAPKAGAKKTAAPRIAKTTKAATPRSAVSTRTKPAGT